ncbi:hypothetical protein [Pontibacter mangrovi]|uniref:hypothetical protein n=1 Tax=Pontibacter mangrovi TaxID=2589816 RepID=UPI0015E40501|nr:hypothetical protein [Pontibacter mangrovi]
MSALDDLKRQWDKGPQAFPAASPYDKASFGTLIQLRMKKQHNMIFRYFWASFTFHLIVYALLTHVMIRHWNDTGTLVLGLTGLLATVPFTAMMLRRYKQMALSKVNRESMASIHASVTRQRNRLASFYAFKRRYELAWIPLLSAIGVVLVFNLFFPGGVMAFPLGAAVTYALTLLSCLLAIRSENRKYFNRPLQELQSILDDYKS